MQIEFADFTTDSNQTFRSTFEKKKRHELFKKIEYFFSFETQKHGAHKLLKGIQHISSIENRFRLQHPRNFPFNQRSLL